MLRGAKHFPCKNAWTLISVLGFEIKHLLMRNMDAEPSNLTCNLLHQTFCSMCDEFLVSSFLLEDKQPSPLYTMLPALLLSGSLCSVRWSE